MLDPAWENRFSPVVLSRGYRYYEEGRVIALKPVDDGWIATVDGSQPYLTFVGNDIDASSCDCPYFLDHGLCKHIAAACYEIGTAQSFNANAAGAKPEGKGLSAGGYGATRSAAPDPFDIARKLEDSARLQYLIDILQASPEWRADIVRRFGVICLAELKADFAEGIYPRPYAQATSNLRRSSSRR